MVLGVKFQPSELFSLHHYMARQLFSKIQDTCTSIRTCVIIFILLFCRARCSPYLPSSKFYKLIEFILLFIHAPTKIFKFFFKTGKKLLDFFYKSLKLHTTKKVVASLNRVFQLWTELEFYSDKHELNGIRSGSEFSSVHWKFIVGGSEKTLIPTFVIAIFNGKSDKILKNSM